MTRNSTTELLPEMQLLKHFLSFFFHYFYHGLSWTYDFIAAFVSLGRWKDWVRSVIPYLEGAPVLELGPGPGHLQLSLCKQGCHAFGLEESSQMLHQSLCRLRKGNCSINLARGMAQNLPFGRTFQTVVATFPSDFIFDMHTLSEVHRVLEINGRFVVLLGAWIGGRSFPEMAARWIFYITHQGQQMTEPTWEAVKAPFLRAGFQVETFTKECRASTLQLILAKKVDSDVK